MKGLSTYHNPQREPQKLQKDAKDTVGSGNNKECLQITKESSRMPRNTVPIHCHKQALQGEYNTRTSLYGATQALASRLGNARRAGSIIGYECLSIHESCNPNLPFLFESDLSRAISKYHQKETQSSRE